MIGDAENGVVQDNTDICVWAVMNVAQTWALSEIDLLKHPNSNGALDIWICWVHGHVITRITIFSGKCCGSLEWQMLTEASQSRSDDCAATLPLCTPPSQTSQRLSDCAHRFDASDVRLSGTLLQTGLSVFSFTVWSFLPRSTNRSPFHAFRLLLTSSPHSCFTARACLWIPSASLTRYISRPGCLELTDVCSGDVWKNVLAKKAELNCDAIQCNFAPVGFEVMMEVGRDALVSMSWMTKVKMIVYTLSFLSIWTW